MVAPSSLLDPTGTNDVADKLRSWLATVPNGYRAVVSPGTYRHEGGVAGAVNMTGKLDVSLDWGGVKFIQKTKRPFVVVADSSNGNKTPGGRWNIIYGPTGAFKTYYEGWVNGVSAYDRAMDKRWDLNRARSFFKFNKCARLSLLGVSIIGAAGIDPAFSDDVESQNAIGWYGSLDCEMGDIDFRNLYGNGYEANRYDDPNGVYVPTKRLWCHDGNISDCGRQAMSLSYGGDYIVERMDLAGSIYGRALIDMEPTTNRNPDGQSATVQGVYVIDNHIGKHRLGMVAAGLTRGDVADIYVARNVGAAISTSGTMYARRVIYEDNTDTDADIPPNMCKFAMGPQWGARDVIVRRNKSRVSESGVKFHDGQGSGGVVNYYVANNDFGGKPQFVDYNVPKWSGTFQPFSLPLPAHALRDN